MHTKCSALCPTVSMRLMSLGWNMKYIHSLICHTNYIGYSLIMFIVHLAGGFNSDILCPICFM